MRIEVTLDTVSPTVVLHEPREMRSFDVVLTGNEGVRPAIEHAGIPRFEQHLWIPEKLIRELAGAEADEAWEADFAQLVEFAKSKGWYDEELAAIRGHVV